MELTIAVGVVVAFTTIWVTYDAAANRVPIAGDEYALNNGALAWLLSCALLCLPIFPYYLVRRSHVLSSRHQLRADSSVPKLCPHCGKYYEGMAYRCPHCDRILAE